MKSELRYALLDEIYIDLSALSVFAQGRETRLTPKACAVLRELMLCERRVVRRDDLLGTVWRDSFPSADVLIHAIRELRRALGDDPSSPKTIETIPRVGYRLTVPVQWLDAPREGTVSVDDAKHTSPPSAAVEPVPQKELLVPSPSVKVVRVRPAARELFITLGVASGLALLVAAVWRYATGTEPSHGPRSASPIALTSEPGTEYFSALSPDGAWVAYVEAAVGELDSRLVLKASDPAAQARVLVPKQANRYLAHPVWSADGARLLFAEVGPDHCALRVVSAGGDDAQTVAACTPSAVDGFDWDPDGEHIYVSMPREGPISGARTLARLSLKKGTSERLQYEPRSVDDVDLYPRISPDRRWIAFRRGIRPYADLWIVPRAGGIARPVAALGSYIQGVTWSSDSAHLIVSSDHSGLRALYRVAIKDGRVEPTGIVNARFPSAARYSDLVAYHEEQELFQLAAFDLADDGTPSPLGLVAPASRSDYAPSLSPEGRQLAFVSLRSGTPQVWLHDMERRHSRMLTRISHRTPDFPVWSQDSRRLLYVLRGAGSSDLMEIDLETGRERALGGDKERIRFGSYASDGQWIYYSSDLESGWQIWRMRPDGSERRRLTRDGGLDPRSFPGDSGIYFSKLLLNGLFRLEPSTGEEREVSRRISFSMNGAYQISGDRLTIFRRVNADTSELVERPLAGGPAMDSELRQVSKLHLAGSYPLPVAALDQARRRIVVTSVTMDGSDVMLARLRGADR